jgi:adenylate cyclase
MKYRTKLYLSLAGTASISSLFGFGVLFNEFRDHAFADQQIKSVTVAATTAALLNPELIEQVNTPADEHSATYDKAKEELIKARDANRRQDVYVYFLYTIKPNPHNPGHFIYSVDAEEDPQWVSHPGDNVASVAATDITDHLNEDYSPGKFISDWGTWTTGYAPLYDKNGKYVATVGADISIQRFSQIIFFWLQIFIAATLASLILAFIGGHLIAKQITLSLSALLLCVREIGQGNLNAKASLKTKDEFAELANEINKMSAGLKERERLKLNFARYVSQHVMEKILKAETVAKLEGERRKITVLFSDIRQFAELAEQLAPEEVVSILDEYFELMLDVIFLYQGTLDKFLGDGIMVEFGAPLDDQEQEKHAVQAAIGMQKELQKLLIKWEKEGKPRLEIGVGVHTGQAIVGNIGSEKRIEYTAIGDTVNIAARLEQATKVLKKPILVSETTYEAVKDQFKATSLGPMILPGRKEPITIYSIEVE